MSGPMDGPIGDDELLAALIEDPEALGEGDWTRARAIASADRARLRLHLRMDELLGRALEPARADLHAAIRHRLEHPVASARFASSVMRRRQDRPAWCRALAPLALAAALAVAIGGVSAIWWRTSAPAPSPVEMPIAICRVAAGAGEVGHAHDGAALSSGALAVGDALASGDTVTASAAGATLRYDDGTTLALGAGARVRLLAPDAQAGKRAALDDGGLAAEVAPQPAGHPFVIATADSEITVIGTAFTLTARDQRTRLEVTHGRVRLARLSDRAQVEVAAGESVVVSGISAAEGAGALVVVPRARRVLYERDFEDGLLSPDAVGTVADGPPRVGNRHCVAGVAIADQGDRPLTRVMLVDSAAGLFTCRAGTELSFDYWVDDRVSALAVYVWDRTRQSSCGGFELYAPDLVKSRWGHAVVRLADLRTGTALVQAGDLITEVTIQNAEAGALFVDDIRVTAPPPE